MKEPLEKQEKQTGWYISQNPIDKYLKRDRTMDSTLGKLDEIKSENRSSQQNNLRQHLKN